MKCFNTPVGTHTGYDLDGVLCTLFKPSKPFRQRNGEERRKYKLLKREHVQKAKCIRNTTGEIINIITARKSDLFSDTVLWLKKHDVKYHRLLMLDTSRTRNNIIDFKRRMIEMYHIDQFFEDDPKIARRLNKLCPQTQIVLVPVSEKHIVREEDVNESRL